MHIIQKLLQHPLFTQKPEAHDTEHSVQIQLPLLQSLLGDFELVPVVVGQLTFEEVRKTADVLRGFLDSKTLLIASSDFTHFGPSFGYTPFGQPYEANIKKLDRQAFDYIQAADTKGFLQFCKRTGATICGRIPIAVLMELVEKGHTLQMMQHTTSGDMTGDYSNSVSYISAVCTGLWHTKTVQQKNAEGRLTDAEGEQLVLAAKQAIEFYLSNQRRPSLADLGLKPASALLQKRAAFVTLKKEGQLRGCIGDILPSVALIESVIRNAVNAAINDPRFQPVTKAEFNKCDVGISALTVPSPISSHKEIRIGTDGVILRKSGHSAVFLPQVAPEQGWDVATTLNHLAQKAGLPARAWQEGAELQVFQAELFGKE